MAPPHQPNKNEYPDPAAFFQQMMSGLDPSRSGATGRGVDHSGTDNNTNYPTFWPGFPFGHPPYPPAPPGPPGSDHSRPPSPPAPPGPGPAPPPPPPPDHDRHGRHRHHHPPGAWSWGGGGGGWGDWDANDGDFHFGDGHRHGRHGGRHGRGRRHHHHDSDEDGTREKPVNVSGDDTNKSSDEKKPTQSGDEKTGSPDTVRDDVPDPDEMVPEYEEAAKSRNEAFTGGWGGFGHGWGGRRGRGGRGGDWHRGSGRRHHHPDRNSCPFSTAPLGTADAGPSGGAAFNFPDMMRGFMNHPFLQHMGAAARNYNSNNTTTTNTADNHDDVDSFAPPVDLFNTAHAYVLHVALPGAKREDVGVHWDPEHGTLAVSGVVHRPGDEAFLQTLHSAERRVGVFEKKIPLPPRDVSGQLQQQEKQQPREEIDVEGIAAKLDDGVLVIIVPKMEKEWTEVRKVDIL